MQWAIHVCVNSRRIVHVGYGLGYENHKWRRLGKLNLWRNKIDGLLSEPVLFVFYEYLQKTLLFAFCAI